MTIALLSVPTVPAFSVVGTNICLTFRAFPTVRQTCRPTMWLESAASSLIYGRSQSPGWPCGALPARNRPYCSGFSRGFDS